MKAVVRFGSVEVPCCVVYIQDAILDSFANNQGVGFANPTGPDAD